MLSRREFLATTVVATTAPALVPAAVPRSPVIFAAQTGLLERTVGCDVVAQIERAAELGFRAFCEPQWRLRTESERRAIRAAALRLGVCLGPIIGPSFPRNASDARNWQPQLTETIHLARESGLTGVRVPLGHLPGDPFPEFWTEAVSIASSQGIVLMIDPWYDMRYGPLVRSYARRLALADPQNAKATLDLGLWKAHDIHTRSNHYLGHVELPRLTTENRVHLGRAMAAVVRDGYRGLFTLGQALSAPTRAAEADVVAQCRALEQLVTSNEPWPLKEI